jgi:hypothetical protein
MNVRLLGGGPVDPAVLLDTRDSSVRCGTTTST